MWDRDGGCDVRLRVELRRPAWKAKAAGNRRAPRTKHGANTF